MASGAGIDYQAVFHALPGAVALLTPDLVYADANEAFLSMSGRTRDQVIGRYLFDVFPDNPHDPSATGMRNLYASLQRVAATGEPDTMALQRYDVEYPDRPRVWEERYWSPVSVPVPTPDGTVALLLHRVEEVTELIRARGGRPGGDRAQVLEAELYTRARELQEVNERLRQAHAREPLEVPDRPFTTGCHPTSSWSKNRKTAVNEVSLDESPRRRRAAIHRQNRGNARTPCHRRESARPRRGSALSSALRGRSRVRDLSRPGMRGRAPSGPRSLIRVAPPRAAVTGFTATCGDQGR